MSGRLSDAWCSECVAERNSQCVHDAIAWERSSVTCRWEYLDLFGRLESSGGVDTSSMRESMLRKYWYDPWHASGWDASHRC